MAIQKLTQARLVQQLRVLVQPEVVAAAARLGAQMQKVTVCPCGVDVPPALNCTLFSTQEASSTCEAVWAL